MGRGAGIVGADGVAGDDGSRAAEADGAVVPLPGWISPVLKHRGGHDSLGLQTTTQDRLMPELLPGILQLSRRARYLSFYAFLLSTYAQDRQPESPHALHQYIRRWEWDYGLAVLHCPRGCGSSPIGARRLDPLVRGGTGPFPRGLSVKSPQGGYGLNYRAPLMDFGVVVREGTPLGGIPLPLDVLSPAEPAQRLADTFRTAVRDTAYHRGRMWEGDFPLEAHVLEEFAEAACLCRLDEHRHGDEREALHAVMLGAGAADTDSPTARQRSLSVAHFLSLIEADPEVVASVDAFRQALWEPATRGRRHAVVAGQWAAVAAKDVWQEALCSLWDGFCAAGSSQGKPLTWQEAREVAYGLLPRRPPADAASRTSELVAALAAETVRLTDEHGHEVAVAGASLEKLRQLVRSLRTADSAVVLVLELMRRMEGRAGPGWDEASAVGSRWQPSLARVAAELRAHLAPEPVVGETVWWLLRRFVLEVHERIAYSKLPEFTFRFRWEHGLLRFYDLPAGGLSPAGIRAEVLASLTGDLGLWRWPDGSGGPRPAELTDRGRQFVERVLG
ncbi:hypothetical protein [Streptomyces sp. NBC_01408]|uniref:hypothetical protein n=1 Tax=Streptomyces sp. NBC_01408 TaxID=2903855 RepID=UPI002254A10B|nr:hypothetical protein [Streptomyces sp. NBC_01408]MCX4695887.1 hypothetical protein [Streptomyces sp. NBC_01408]